MKLKTIFDCCLRGVESEDGRWSLTHETTIDYIGRCEFGGAAKGRMSLDGNLLRYYQKGYVERVFPGWGYRPTGSDPRVEFLSPEMSKKAQEFFDAANKQAFKRPRTLTIIEEIEEGT